MAKEKQTSKKLSLANAQKEVKKLSTQTEHTLDINGTEYKVKIDDKFLKSKQHELIDDLIEFFNFANDDLKLLDVVTPYTSLLFIKHFTDVEVSDDIDKALDMLQALINLEIFAPIQNLMPEKEVVEVFELLTATTNRMKDNMDITAEEAERMADVVQNEKLKEMLNNGKEQ